MLGLEGRSSSLATTPFTEGHHKAQEKEGTRSRSLEVQARLVLFPLHLAPGGFPCPGWHPRSGVSGCPSAGGRTSSPASGFSSPRGSFFFGKQMKQLACLEARQHEKSGSLYRRTLQPSRGAHEGHVGQRRPAAPLMSQAQLHPKLIADPRAKRSSLWTCPPCISLTPSRC